VNFIEVAFVFFLLLVEQSCSTPEPILEFARVQPIESLCFFLFVAQLRDEFPCRVVALAWMSIL